MRSVINKPCGKSGCLEKGKYSCGRCKKACYCSIQCQKDSWSSHKSLCKISDKSMPEYKWTEPSLATRYHWCLEDFLKGPDQPMDPPEEFDYLNDWWGDQKFYLHGKLVFEASLFPPSVKELIREVQYYLIHNILVLILNQFYNILYFQS
jgi:MYND finger